MSQPWPVFPPVADSVFQASSHPTRTRCQHPSPKAGDIPHPPCGLLKWLSYPRPLLVLGASCVVSVRMCGVAWQMGVDHWGAATALSCFGGQGQCWLPAVGGHAGDVPGNVCGHMMAVRMTLGLRCGCFL